MIRAQSHVDKGDQGPELFQAQALEECYSTVRPG